MSHSRAKLWPRPRFLSTFSAKFCFEFGKSAFLSPKKSTTGFGRVFSFLFPSFCLDRKGGLRQNYIPPPYIWPQDSFQRRGVYILRPPAAGILYPPPLYTTPPLKWHPEAPALLFLRSDLLFDPILFSCWQGSAKMPTPSQNGPLLVHFDVHYDKL